jgi:hypothetical protein
MNFLTKQENYLKENKEKKFIILKSK